MVLYIIGAVVVFAIIIVVWWKVFFGTPNPPLPTVTVSVASSTAPGVASTTSTVTPTSSASAVASSSGIDQPIVTGENPPLPTEPLAIDGATFTVELATTTLNQSRGLSYRPSLAANAGMLFIFGSGSTQTFWMLGMNFPLDMIWISGDTVVGFAQDVPAPAPGTQPWELPIYSSPPNTDKVLEVNAGTVAKYNIKVGDTVTIGNTTTG